MPMRFSVHTGEDFRDTPFNRGMHTAERLFPDAVQRRSFRWRTVVVMGIAMDKKYRNYRNEGTTKKELRASFDALFRRVMKATREWVAANPGLLQRH
jgi:hypothetical protein